MEDIRQEEIDQKSRLRELFKKRAADYGFDVTAKENVLSNLVTILPKGITVASFRAKSDEININTLEVLRPDLKVAYPLLAGRDLQFWQPSHAKAFKLGRYQIEEPDTAASKPIGLSQVDMILVPGLAFDRSGGRLGRGQGFYDRALQSFSGLKVGIATVAQISEEDLPLEDHDVSMNVVITDKYILRVFSS